MHFDQPSTNVLQVFRSLTGWEDDGQVEVGLDDDRVGRQQVRMGEDLPIRGSKCAGGVDLDDVVALEVPLLLLLWTQQLHSGFLPAEKGDQAWSHLLCCPTNC